MIKTYKRRPHVHAERVSKTTSQSSGSQTITTGWKPHVIFGAGASSSGNEGALFISGENDSGTNLVYSSGHDASNNAYDAATVGVQDTSGNGWTATIAFNSRGYVITWTKTGSGLDVTFDFMAIRGKRVHYETDTDPGSSSVVDYTTTWDPDIVFCIADDSYNDKSIGWGADGSSGYSNCIRIRHNDNFVGPGEGGASFTCYRTITGEGWRGIVTVGSGKFSCDWYKFAGSANATTAHFWAIQFQDMEPDYETGAPSSHDFITGLSYTPIACIFGGRWAAGRGSMGIVTSEGQICVCSFNTTSTHKSITGDGGRRGASTSAYYECDISFSSGKVTNSVTTHGSPSGSSSPNDRLVAFGENSGLGGVE